MRLPRTALTAAALATVLLLPAAPAIAGEVTSLADDGPGTLRAQIAAADPGEVIVFQAGLTGTIVLNSELLIQKNLTIDGPGARQLRISGGDTTRVLRVSEPTAEVEIEGVTIEHGMADGTLAFGGGLLVEAVARLRLERVSLVDNAADSGDSSPGFGGGAFVVDGELELIDSTVARNRVVDEDGGGGGLFIADPGTSFEIIGSTIAANQADLGAGVTAAGAHGKIEDTTIARNVAVHGGGIVTSPTVANVEIARSLVTANEAGTAAGCDGLVTSLGHNVLDDVSGCGFTAATGDSTGIAAPVGTLGDHGGPTDTLLPLLGNPALDRVPVPCPGADQRGQDRPRGPGCDAGAVEARPATLTAGPLALGAAQVGQQTPLAATLVTNTGEVAATVTGVSLSGPNAAEMVVADECAGVLEPGAACRIQARLAPTSVGPKQATYSVALAAPGTGVDVAVTGTGDPAPPPPADPGSGGSTNPSPAPQPSSAEAVLVGSRTKAGKGGKLKLRLRCTTVSACMGSLTLKLGARKLTKAFSIAAGKELVVTLKLGAGDRRKLARKRSLSSAATVVTTQPDGTRKTTHQGAFKLLRAGP